MRDSSLLLMETAEALLTLVPGCDRSGPVHGITSIQKAEAAAQMNGTNVRGSSKGDSDAAPPSTERGDRYSAPERERPLSKNGVKYVFLLLNHKRRADVHVLLFPSML